MDPEKKQQYLFLGLLLGVVAIFVALVWWAV